jgi:transposase
VATDMGRAYIRAVRDNLPRAVHVFDHFHVVKLYNDKLSAFRRQLYANLSDDEQRRVLKGTRWLLLKNPEGVTRLPLSLPSPTYAAIANGASAPYRVACSRAIRYSW